MYHSLRRKEIKGQNSRAATAVKSIRPIWFEDETAAKTPAEPMHGLLFFRPTPYGSRQVVYQTGKRIAFCKLTN